MTAPVTFYCWGGSLHGKTYTLPDVRPLTIKLASFEPVLPPTPEPLPWWKNKLLNLIGVKPVMIHYGQQNTIEETYNPFHMRYRDYLLRFLVCSSCEKQFYETDENEFSAIFLKHKDQIGDRSRLLSAEYFSRRFTGYDAAAELTALDQELGLYDDNTKNPLIKE